MRSHPRRLAAAIMPTAVAVAAVAGALALSGCGSSSVSNIVDPVARAASVSNAARGYQMSFSMSIASPALPTPIAGSGTGSFEPTSRTGQMSMSMNLGSSVAAVLGSSSLTVRELIDGTTFYMQLPSALMSRIPGNKPWLKVDLASLGSQAGIPGLSSLFSNPTSTNPAAMLQYLKAVSGGITKVGTATVDGHATTEYRATIDFAKYPSIVPSAQRAAAQQAVTGIEHASGLKRFPVSVWIDQAHLVRRMQFAFTTKLPSTTNTVSTAMTLDITGYGSQTAPAFPPASDVADLSALLGSGG